MNVRVFLVVLVSGLFMAVWNADQAAMKTALARKTQPQNIRASAGRNDSEPLRRITESPIVLTSVKDGTGCPPRLLCVPDCRPAATSEVKAEPAEAFIPLPANLADGTWQVISQSGELFRITISRVGDDSTAPQTTAESREQNFCITSTPDGDRWCFVRIQTETVIEEKHVATETNTPVQR